MHNSVWLGSLLAVACYENLLQSVSDQQSLIEKTGGHMTTQLRQLLDRYRSLAPTERDKVDQDPLLRG